MSVPYHTVLLAPAVAGDRPVAEQFRERREAYLAAHGHAPRRVRISREVLNRWIDEERAATQDTLTPMELDDSFTPSLLLVSHRALADGTLVFDDEEGNDES